MGLRPPGRVPDTLPALGGGFPVDQAAYLARVEWDPVQALPSAPPAPPFGSELARRFPTPVDFPAVIAAAFEAAGLPPAATPAAAHFADPARAASEWSRAVAARTLDVRDPLWLVQWKHTRVYLEQLDKTVQSIGCASCDDALARLVSYLEEVTRRRVATSGRMPPRRQDVDPLRSGGNGRSQVLAEYGEWWSQ